MGYDMSDDTLTIDFNQANVSNELSDLKLTYPNMPNADANEAQLIYILYSVRAAAALSGTKHGKRPALQAIIDSVNILEEALYGIGGGGGVSQMPGMQR